MYTGQLPNTPYCPHCKSKIDGFTSLEGEHTPEEGDISVCCYCKTVLELNSSGNFIYATADTLAEVDFPTLQKANRIVAKLELWKC